MRECEAKGVPAGPITDMGEVFDDPKVIDRGLQLDLDGVPSVRTPITFSEASLACERASPGLGEHTAEITEMLKR